MAMGPLPFLNYLFIFNRSLKHKNVLKKLIFSDIAHSRQSPENLLSRYKLFLTFDTR
jgi:hypothetical protein